MEFDIEDLHICIFKHISWGSLMVHLELAEILNIGELEWSIYLIIGDEECVV